MDDDSFSVGQPHPEIIGYRLGPAYVHALLLQLFICKGTLTFWLGKHMPYKNVNRFGQFKCAF